MYKNVNYINLKNTIFENGKLYKKTNTKPIYNGKAQIKTIIKSIENGIGFEYLNTLTQENTKFAIGFTTKNIIDVKYPTDLDYYIWIKTGNLGYVKLYNKEHLYFITSNIHTSYKIEVINDTIFGFFVDNKLKFSFNTDYNINDKLKIILILKDNYNYGIDLRANTDNIDEIKLLNVNPSLKNKINIFSTINLVFDNQLDVSTINKTNILLREYPSKILVKDYDVTINNKTISVLFTETPLEYNKTYEIYIPKNKIKSVNNNLKNDKISLTFTTIDKYEQPIEEKLGFSNNPNDIYYKMNNLYNLLDIDWINEYGEDFDFYYKPTKYNPITKKYEIENYKPYIRHNNKEVFLDILRHDFLPEFDNYFKYIRKYVRDVNLLNKLQALLIKNIVNINFFKGNREQIKFLVRLYAQLTDETMVWVDKDPFLNFKYRVSSDVPYINWDRDIKKITHPTSFEDKYIYIPYQIPNYIDNVEDDVKKQSSVFKKKFEDVTYIDISHNQYIKKQFIFPSKNIANAKWKDLISTHFFPFRANQYNVYENTSTKDFYYELCNKFNKEIKQIKHYRDNPSIFYIKYKKYYYGLDYKFNFTFNGVNLYNKMQPFLDFTLKKSKYPSTLYLDFIHRDNVWSYRYKLLPFISQKWNKDKYLFGTNSNLNYLNTNILNSLQFSHNLRNFKTPYKSRYSFQYNYIEITNNPDPNLNYTNNILELDTKGFYIENTLYLYKNNKLYHTLSNIPNKIKINKNNWDKIKVKFKRKDFEVIKELV